MLDYFKKNEPQKTSIDNEPTFVIKMYPDMSVKLFCEWNNKQGTEDWAISLATMLKFLTSGMYDTMIIQSLLSLGITNNVDKNFIECLVNFWKSDEVQRAQESILNSPIVNPLNTFSESNFLRQG